MTTIRLRRGTTQEWATANPVLEAGEPGYDVTTRLLGVGDGTTAWVDLPKHLDEDASDARYALRGGGGGAAGTAGGRRWAFLGDSITDGAAASNAAFSFPARAVELAGTVNASAAYIEAGVPGSTVADLASRVQQTLDAGAEALVVAGGTNDASTAAEAGTPLAEFQQAYDAVLSAAGQRGVPVVVCTIPPYAGDDAANRDLVTFNTWLRLWAPSRGAVLAEVWGALVDPATGDLAAAYQSGDHVHPNNAGHHAMARAVAAAMRAVTPDPDRTNVLAKTALSLIANPLMLGGGDLPTGWYEQPGGSSGAAATYSTTDDDSGFLPAGRWAQVELDAAGGAAVCTFATGLLAPGSNPGRWAPGDELAFMGHAQVEDLAGTWEAAVVAGDAALVPSVRSGGAAVRVTWERNPGRRTGPRYDLGPWFVTLTVPDGATDLNCWVRLALPAGAHVRGRVGCLDVINLTRRGLAGIDHGSDVVHVPA